MTLSLGTAYRSFGGEVEASSTPTICRLPDSRRHQLSAIARRCMRCGTASRPTCSKTTLISEPSRRCSEGRHTAREQQAEARITYRFHPRFGETVGVRRRLERGGAAFLVVHQLDGTFACLPAWMTEEAASRFEISVEPHFPLDVLCSLRNEVDALLGFLASESKTERPDNDAPIRESPD